MHIETDGIQATTLSYSGLFGMFLVPQVFKMNLDPVKCDRWNCFRYFHRKQPNIATKRNKTAQIEASYNMHKMVWPDHSR
jgi:hypothetical protein